MSLFPFSDIYNVKYDGEWPASEANTSNISTISISEGSEGKYNKIQISF